MINQPLVSIVTPSFNQAPFLEETLQSVLGQDYPNIEYLVIDAGSSDGSVDIIQHYAHRLAWWVSEKDLGQAEGINKGLGRARGEIVAWLNSDDLFLPGTLTAAVEAFASNPACGMVFGDMLAIDAGGKTTNHLKYGDWSLPDLMQFRIIGQPAVFMRRSVLERTGLLDPAFHFLLDHQLWLRIAQFTPIRHVSSFWAAARFHPAAKNVAQARHFGQDAYRIVEWIQAQPALASLYNTHQRHILAGAHRMNARYLLDGGLPAEAFGAYMKCLASSPAVALPELHRMLFAGVSTVVNVDWMKERFLDRRQNRITKNDRRGD